MNQLKKPQQVSIHTFFTHVEQLNSYISLLPSVYNSPKATEHMKPAEPFEESVLACILLTMCPHAWQSQYNMNQIMLPQDTRQLLVVLENIENMVFTNSNVPTKSPNTNGNNANGKSRKMENARIPIPLLIRFRRSLMLRNTVPCARNMGSRRLH